MSYDATGWAWRQDVRGTKKLVLLALANWADDEHQAFPAYGKLADLCGVSRGAVKDAVRALEEAGLLVRDRRHRENGSTATNVFRLALEGGSADRPGEVSQPTGGGQPADPLDTSQDTQQNPSSPQPEIEGLQSPAAPPELDEPAQVWAHYIAVMKPRKTEMDQQLRRLIVDALKCATVDECCAAIDGCAASDFHMKRGQYANRTGPLYKQLSQILKGKRGGRTTREQIEFFMEIAHAAKAARGGTGIPSALNERLATAKRSVLAAWEFPGDEAVVKRGTLAADWLAQHGVEVVRDPSTGRPSFRAAS